jgi:hypothetical protein
MRYPRHTHLALVLLFLATGCTDRDLTTAPAYPGNPLHAISDGARNGTHGFYFLPPMVESPAYGGTFDASLSPVVEVCATPACAALHASYSMTQGVGSEVVRISGERYMVNWHTNQTEAAAGQTYRVRVRVNAVVLGHADVAVVSTGRQAIEVRSDGSIALVANQTLPVIFRIETGIVGAVVVSPAEATIDVGGTQQFAAALYDLHGEPLVGPAVTWSSGNTGVATVDASGLTTGVIDGAATISASAGPAAGTAQLTVSGSAIAAAWHALSSEIGGIVNSFAIHDGDLIAGGYFTSAGGQAASRVARWDGSAWQALGTGVNALGTVGDAVMAVTVYNGDVIAGGQFTTAGGQSANRIARWDGSAWQAMGTGMDDVVWSLIVYDGDLIAGGSFITAGGEAANRVARWDGSTWQPMGTGMDNRVHALTLYQGDLIASGVFLTAGGQTANRVARWDGSGWAAVGTGTSGPTYALSVYKGDLIAGGFFTAAGGQPANRVARWDGSAWQAMGTGMDTWVATLIAFEDDLIAGGLFTTAGGQTANRVARWDGSAWNSMGTGMNAGVNAVTVHGDDLIAGGRFTNADGLTARYIARWGTP